MKIKTVERKSRKTFVRPGSFQSLLKILTIILISSVGTYIAVTKIFTQETAESVWKWAADHGHAALRNDISLRDVVWKMPGRLVNTIGQADVPKIAIDINFKNAEKLRSKRDEALEKGLLIQDAGDFLPASIRHGNKNTKVKLRLKGDLTDHLGGRKWSFRINVKGKDHIFGMRRFSIQHPKVRGFHSEILFFETLRHLGVLAPRYFFIDVTINGEPIGLMAVEEHFSKELLEANGRRESVIIRFDESLYWDESREIPEGKRVFSSYRNAPIDAFRSALIKKSPKLSMDYGIAVGLLRGFVEGELPASSVFDTKSLGRFLAAAQFWGSWHAVRWHNQRFYLNPITMKLEPIGFDANLQSRRDADEELAKTLKFMSAMLEDPAISEVYRSTLDQISREIVDGDLGDRIKKIEQQQLTVLRKEFLFLEKLPDGELRNRATHFLAQNDKDSELNDVKSAVGSRVSLELYPTLIHAYQIEDETSTYLELANGIPYDVEIQSIVWSSGKNNPDVPFQPDDKVRYPIRLTRTSRGVLPRIHRINYQKLETTIPYRLSIMANILGHNETQSIEATPYARILKRNPIPISTVQEQLARHSFLNLDQQTKRLNIGPGQWSIYEPLIVPPGYSMTVSKGTTLRFSSHGSLIAYGPLYMRGSPDETIILEGIASGEDQGSWFGIAVLNAGKPSEWSYVRVRNTTGVRQDGWRLTGGVNFYRSDIKMEKCRLEGNLAEDALNIIHSRFELNGIVVMDTVSDGFDSDFSEGTLSGGVFEYIGKAGGGDGIDVSGSNITVNGTRFREISDKALSIGEQSEMSARDVSIEKVGTGAACKDGSKLEINNSTIKDALNVGLMAYTKKSEFGGGHIDAKAMTFVGNVPAALAQRGSTIAIDGEYISEQDVDVEELYNTIMKPGLR